MKLYVHIITSGVLGCSESSHLLSSTHTGTFLKKEYLLATIDVRIVTANPNYETT